MTLESTSLLVLTPTISPPSSLAQPEQVSALINYVVDDPPDGSEDKVGFIYPFNSSEVMD